MKKAFAVVPALYLLLLFSIPPSAAQTIEVNDISSGTAIGRLSVYSEHGALFFPFDEFTSLSLPTEYYSLENKAVLRYNGRKISFVAFTPFIQVDDKWIQLTRDVAMRHGVMLIPIKEWVEALQRAGVEGIAYDSRNRRLSMRLLTPNLIAVESEPWPGGTVVTIKSTRPFSASELTAAVQGEWVTITVRGGVFAAGLSVRLPEEVFESVPENLGKEGCRLRLHPAPGMTFERIETAADRIRIRLRKSGNNIAVLKELEHEKEKWRIDTIVIDPGHGGKDPGCVGENGIYEKHLTLSIARALRDELQKRLNVKVVMTRDRDEFVPLKKRTQIANRSGGKLFISIHIDANRVKSLRGHTVYFMGPAKTDEAREAAQFENSVIRFEDSPHSYEGISDAAFILAANAQNSFNRESQELAALAAEAIARETGSHNIGVRQAGFYVLYGASMPNILVECGFMSNGADRRNLTDPYYQKKLAEALCKAVFEFKERFEQPLF